MFFDYQFSRYTSNINIERDYHFVLSKIASIKDDNELESIVLNDFEIWIEETFE